MKITEWLKKEELYEDVIEKIMHQNLMPFTKEQAIGMIQTEDKKPSYGLTGLFMMRNDRWFKIHAKSMKEGVEAPESEITVEMVEEKYGTILTD